MRTGKPERTKELSQQMQEGGMVHNRFTRMVSAQCMCEYWKGADILNIQIMQNGVYVG